MALPAKVANDDSLMQYAVKGSDKQWEKALKGKEISESGTVQIQSVREKRKQLSEQDIEREAELNPASKKAKADNSNKKKGDNSNKKKKRGRK
jgi:hypothetical protein